MAPNIKLGELLVKARVLHEGQLRSALVEQQKWGGKLGEILVRMNILTEELLVRALAKQLGVPVVNLENVQVPAHVRNKIPIDLARDLTALPLQLRDDGKTLVVAMCDPLNVQHLDTLRAVTKCRVVPQLAGRTAIARAFARLYDREAELSDPDESFKVVDAQGRTLGKAVRPPEGPASSGTPTPPPGPDPARARVPLPASGMDAIDLLRTLEEVQRKEVSALKAMVELLIERGVFTREEYLARVRR